jgi:hypothetical protein
VHFPCCFAQIGKGKNTAFHLPELRDFCGVLIWISVRNCIGLDNKLCRMADDKVPAAVGPDSQKRAPCREKDTREHRASSSSSAETVSTVTRLVETRPGDVVVPSLPVLPDILTDSARASGSVEHTV